MVLAESSRPWKTIGSVVVDDTSVLGALVRRANELGRYEECLKGYLDMHGAERLRVAAIEDGTLVVLVDSAVWSAKLRFLAPRIVAHAARALGRENLERIDVRIHPDPVREPDRPQPDRAAAPTAAGRLLPATRELLRCTACTFEDGRLKKVLLRMAGSEPARTSGTTAPHAPGRLPESRRRRA